MAIPDGIGIIDTMLGFPGKDMKQAYRFITQQTKDTQSKEDFEFPVEYLFKESPDKELQQVVDPVALVIGEMDRWGVAKAMISVADDNGKRAFAEHPGRFVGSTSVDPNQGMDAIRKIVTEHAVYDTRAVTAFPAGTFPQVPINDKKMYPIYAKCVELDLAVFVCAGIPGPRVPFACQHVELIDEVMFDFPELRFVTRHGCEPWQDLAVKLMLKWPNLHYSTSAFAPRYYPQAIVDYANSRGADRVIYGGYFPMGLSLERIMTEMPGVGFKDDVWPKFLRDNAARVLRLDE